MSEALRFNTNKPRYDLLEPHAINELVKVFTAGSLKYADRNWEKGMKWSKMLASLKRHIAAFEAGEEYDPELGTHHMANAAWNALGLVTYTKTHPELDDRNHSYLQPKRIGLDIDEVISDFTGAYAAKTGSKEKPDYWAYCDNMMENFEKWTTDGTIGDFYMGINPLVEGGSLPFEPTCYITSRPVETEVTRQWIKKHGFPQKPIFTTKTGADKLQVALDQKLDYFIDDNYDTFVKLNQNGVCCFLMDAAHNRKYNVGYRRVLSLEDFKNRFL